MTKLSLLYSVKPLVVPHHIGICQLGNNYTHEMKYQEVPGSGCKGYSIRTLLTSPQMKL